MEGAILDACVLYPATLRDFLLRLAQAGVYAPFWSETILEECFRSVQRDRPDLSASQLARTRKFMNDAFEEVYWPTLNQTQWLRDLRSMRREEQAVTVSTGFGA